MNKIDYQALREAAEKAGEDKWQAKKINGDFFVIRHGSYTRQHGYTSYQPIAEIDCKQVRDFVAKANPATVLELLDELEAAKKRIAELEAREVVLPRAHDVHPLGPQSAKIFCEFHRNIINRCADEIRKAGVNVSIKGGVGIWLSLRKSALSKSLNPPQNAKPRSALGSPPPVSAKLNWCWISRSRKCWRGTAPPGALVAIPMKWPSTSRC